MCIQVAAPSCSTHPHTTSNPPLPPPPPPPLRSDNKADTNEDKAFDVLTRELVFEAKAKPGERTLTGGQQALQWVADGIQVCCCTCLCAYSSCRPVQAPCCI